MKSCDFLIVGAGIAGASAACWLARHGSVIVIERESQPGYHTTGRSAAFFVESYGNRHIRPLTIGSKSFFLGPPPGFAATPLLHDRGAIYIAREDQLEVLRKLHDDIARKDGIVALLTADEVLERVPVLRPGYVRSGLLEPGARDIDVNGLHQGFLRAMRAQGGELLTGAELTNLERHGGEWRVETTAGAIRAGVVVNAAGAWADEVASLAGARRLDLEPLRRTVIVFAAPAECDIADWPLIIDAEEDFYFKPESGRILASPADETPMAPCDVQPDELDIAITVDYIQRATLLEVPRLENKWAGLRTFAPDRTPVVGWDPEVSGFFWFAGQGGYGIQTAPAMGELLAGLLVEGTVPDHLAELSVRPEPYSPRRFY